MAKGEMERGRMRGEGRDRGSLGERYEGRMEGERRGDHRTSTNRDPYTERLERERRGGGRYDAGPGMEGMPGARDMDRPPMPCGAFDRHGDRRNGIDREQRTIQDAEGHWREHR